MVVGHAQTLAYLNKSYAADSSFQSLRVDTVADGDFTEELVRVCIKCEGFILFGVSWIMTGDGQRAGVTHQTDRQSKHKRKADVANK